MADFVGRDRHGNEVVLTDGAWFGHIVRRHPEMAGLRAEVEATCCEAEVIRQSSSDPACVLHYRQLPGSPGLLVMVVANTQDGYVRTAHFAKSVTGGAQLWP